MRLYRLVGHTPVPCQNHKEWAQTFGKTNRQVGLTHIGDTQISTVFLGLDHSFSWQNGPPILFETMVFTKNGTLDYDYERCSTWAEAEQQHQRIVDKIKSSQDEPKTV